MGRPAQLTLSGMVNYVPDLFDDMALPTPPIDAAAIGLQADQLRAAWTIDKTELVNYICLKTTGMSLAFPDAEFMRKAIKTWSSIHVHEWQRLFDTLFFKYNPLWNKDGSYRETGRDVEGRTDTAETDGNYKRYTHGYADQTIQIDNLNWTHADLNVDHTSSTDDMDRQLDTTKTHTEQGNIGVTMTQELIAKERELAMLSIDDIITDSFKQQFCIMIW